MSRISPYPRYMDSLDNLRRGAEAAMRFRGHTVPELADWKQLEGGLGSRSARKTFEYTCERCGKSVVIDNRPPANGIDVGGSAVALDCEP